MSSQMVSRHILAVVVLVVSGGCAGGDSLQALTPEPESKVNQAEPDLWTSIQQDISSLSYSTYLGFSGNEESTALAIDGAGNAYISGVTTSFGNTYNIFVAKMSPSGSTLYFTYFPGTNNYDIAVDALGNAYVAGRHAAGPFVTKLNATGTAIVYSVTLGWDELRGIQVDSSGNAYVVGSITNGVAGLDVAVGKLAPTGTTFVYALAFGGNSTDKVSDLAIDSSGNAYIVGTTESTNFPVVNAFQSTLKGFRDAFVAKLNATGTALMYSTYLGGNGEDQGAAIAVDPSGNAYVTGSTWPYNVVQNFPVTSGAAQTTPGGSRDAFAAKFSAAGSRLYATYLGGNDAELGEAITVSSTGVAYVVGTTWSPNFPTSSLAFQRYFQGSWDTFVVQLSPTFNAFTYSTYLGGSGVDTGLDVAVDTSNTVYVAGDTYSTNFPTTVYAPGGRFDAFVTKFNGP